MADPLTENNDNAAPVRFLPECDMVLLSHADRSRLVPPGRRLPRCHPDLVVKPL